MAAEMASGRWRSKRRLRLRVTLLAGVEYVATCTFLLVYWLIGLADGSTTLALFAYSLIANALIVLGIVSGWSERLKDPSMTAIQMAVSCGRDLLGCYFMPLLWFIFVFNLFVALPFGSLQFANRTFVAFWLATCAGLGIVFWGYPDSLQIGFSTRTEKLLLWLFLTAALARLTLFNSRISALRRKLRSKAVELSQASRSGERERLARELHDTVLQSFFGLTFQLTALTEQLPASSPARNDFEVALRAAEAALARGQEQVLRLRQPMTTTKSLVQSLRQAGSDLAYDTALTFVLHLPGDEISLTDEARAAIEAIVLQALANAFHHSEGRNVHLDLRFSPQAFMAEIRDDGRGMREGDADLDRATSHFGIHVMRERADSLGARFDITAAVPRGTLVTLQVPRHVAYELPRTSPPGLIARIKGLHPR
jgi:signal transduction histidine kinase